MLLYSVNNNTTTVTETTTGISASLTTKSDNPVIALIRKEKVTDLLQKAIYENVVKPFIDCGFDFRIIRQPDDFSIELNVDKFQKDRVVPVHFEQTTIKILMYKDRTHLADDNPQMFEWWLWTTLETPIANIITITNLQQLDEFNREQGCSKPRANHCGC